MLTIYAVKQIKKVVSTLALTYFGSPRLVHTIKVNNIKMQTVALKVC